MKAVAKSVKVTAQGGESLRIGISCYPTVGGSGAVATELGKALADRGHEVHFVVTDIPFRLGTFHPNIYVHQMDTLTYPVLRTPPYDLSLAAFMARIIREHHLDILHVHYALPFAVCAFLAKQMVPNHPVKIVTTLHGTDITVLAQDDSWMDVIRLGIERSDVVTAVSHHLRTQTKTDLKIDREILCIHNFVDIAKFHPSPNAALRQKLAGSDDLLMLHVSNFRPVKRVLDTLDVLRFVRESRRARLLLVGEGPDLQAARVRAAELHLTEHVTFLGKQDEVASLYQAADLLLLPSQQESFGLVALEAMACGIPVIATTAGGIPEVVKHAVTGFTTAMGNTEQMAMYAVQLASDSVQYQAFSRASVQRARTYFATDRQISLYEDVYQRIVGARVP